MNYLNIDFPDELCGCFCGGAEFLTSKITLKNKQEIRNQIWQKPRYRYDLIYKNCSERIYQKLYSFFILCQGSNNSFNFTDKSDYKIENQQIGIGDGITASFEIYKTYAYDNLSTKRKIFKTKNEKVYVNNKLIDSKKYTIQNGILTFKKNNIPTVDSIISIYCEFYIIVRFENNFLPVVKKNNVIELPNITLIEVQK